MILAANARARPRRSARLDGGGGLLARRAGDVPRRGSGALERIRARGELRWGADEQGGEPYAYEDRARGGALVGFEVDLAGALAEALGVRARFVQNDWSTLIPALERGSFDIALNGIEVTPARAARVAFTRPYYLFAERLVVRRGDARVHDLASLRGRRVGTLASSQAWDIATAAGAVAVPYEGADEPFVDLAAGRTDAVLLDDIIVARYAPRHPTFAGRGRPRRRPLRGGRAPRRRRPARRPRRARLETLIATGAWRKTLARWGLDNPRQAELTRCRSARHRSTPRGRVASPVTSSCCFSRVRASRC